MEIDIMSMYIFNPIELATTIEAVADRYLKPHTYVPGIYQIGSMKPVMLNSEQYHCRKAVEFGKVIEFQVRCIDDIVGCVYNQNGEIVISTKNKSSLSPMPTLPIRGIKIIETYIDKMLIDNSAWTRCKSESVQNIWSEFVTPEYQNTIEVFELIETLLMEMRNDIKDFIGSDKWIMHFRNHSQVDIIVEKSIDYRIHSWMQEHGWEFKTTKKPC